MEALRYARLLQNISSKVIPNYDPNAIQMSNQSNNILVSNDDNNYYEEAKNLLTNYIVDKHKIDAIIEELNERNENYLKTLVIEWNKYEPILQSLKGSVVSANRIIDNLENSLKESLTRKQNVLPKVGDFKDEDIDVSSIFNGDSIASGLADSEKVVRQTLCKILGIDKNSNTRLIKRSIILNEDKRTKFLLDKYSRLVYSINREVLVTALYEYLVSSITGETDEVKLTSYNKPIVVFPFKRYFDLTNNNLDDEDLSIFKETFTITQKFVDRTEFYKEFSKYNIVFLYQMKNEVLPADDEMARKIHAVKIDTIKEEEDTKDEETKEVSIRDVLDKKKKKIDDETMTIKESKNYLKEVNELKQTINDYIDRQVEKSDSKIVRYKINKIMNMISVKLDKDMQEYFKTDNLVDIDFRIGTKDERELKKIAIKNFLTNIYKPELKRRLTFLLMPIIKSESDEAIVKTFYEVMNLMTSSTAEFNSFKRKMQDIITNSQIVIKVPEMKDESELITGLGLKKHHKIIKNKYYIDRKLLDNHGILEIRYIKNKHLAHIRPPTLHYKTKKVITDLLDDKKINSNEFVSLNDFDKDLIRRINKLFGGNQDLDDDEEELFNKNFEILKGQVMSGNTNHQIKEQLKMYIIHAIDIGKLTHHQGRKLMMDLKLL
jgi:hypothetical protein